MYRKVRVILFLLRVICFYKKINKKFMLLTTFSNFIPLVHDTSPRHEPLLRLLGELILQLK